MSKPFNLPALRGKLGLNQGEMAERLGLSPAAYADLEAAPETIQRHHVLAVHLVSLDVAIERGDPGLASTTVREKALAWHRLQAAQAPGG